MRRELSKFPEYIPKDAVTYKGKIKLHGNNGGVVISEDENGIVVAAQSRNRVLSMNNDLQGFAKWTEANKETFLYVRRELKVRGRLLSSFSFSSLSSSLITSPLPVIASHR